MSSVPSGVDVFMGCPPQSTRIKLSLPSLYNSKTTSEPLEQVSTVREKSCSYIHARPDHLVDLQKTKKRGD